jgi:hypothetical protein
VDGDNDFEQERALAVTVVSDVCQAGTYTNTAEALITFPPGYVIIGGINPLRQTSASLTLSANACAPPPPGGPGGGGSGPIGSCAMTAPSSSARPAVIRPHVITC